MASSSIWDSSSPGDCMPQDRARNSSSFTISAVYFWTPEIPLLSALLRALGNGFTDRHHTRRNVISILQQISNCYVLGKYDYLFKEFGAGTDLIAIWHLTYITNFDICYEIYYPLPWLCWQGFLLYINALHTSTESCCLTFLVVFFVLRLECNPPVTLFFLPSPFITCCAILPISFGGKGHHLRNDWSHSLFSRCSPSWGFPGFSSAGGTTTLAKSFFFGRSPWLHGQQLRLGWGKSFVGTWP